MKSNKKKLPVKKTQSFPQYGSVLILLAILLLTAIIYSRSLGNGFVTWDDPEYVIDNNLIKDFSPKGIKNLFTTFYEGNYHPLTALSNAVEYHFFKLNPKPYHTINLILHLLNIVLVFFVISRLTNRKDAAIIVSLFFAIHPLHVESVAWIAERKDVLYTFFYLASWLAYIRWRDSGIERRKDGKQTIQYFISLLLFACALLSKSMAVTLPIVLMLTDYYRNRKIDGKSILEKLPFFILALIFGLVAIHSQSSSGSTGTAPHFPFYQRIFLSSYGILYYIFKLFVPVHLSAFHPYPVKSGALPFEYYLAPVVLIGLAFGIWRLTQSSNAKSPKDNAFVFGMLFFLVTVAPVIQLLPVGKALTAERYSYVPYIGLFFIVASLFSTAWDKAGMAKTLLKPILVSVVIVYAVVFSVITHQRIPKWKDGIVLFTDMIEKYSNSFGIDFAWYNRALTKNNMADYKGAIEDYSEAIRINPEYIQAWYNRGYSKGMFQDFKGAVTDFNEAIHLYPEHYMAYNNRGNAKGMLSDYSNALKDFSEAIRIKPDYSEAWFNRGFTKLKMGLNKEACDDWRKAISLGYDKADEMMKNYCL